MKSIFNAYLVLPISMLLVSCVSSYKGVPVGQDFATITVKKSFTSEGTKLSEEIFGGSRDILQSHWIHQANSCDTGKAKYIDVFDHKDEIGKSKTVQVNSEKALKLESKLTFLDDSYLVAGSATATKREDCIVMIEFFPETGASYDINFVEKKNKSCSIQVMNNETKQLVEVETDKNVICSMK